MRLDNKSKARIKKAGEFSALPEQGKNVKNRNVAVAGLYALRDNKMFHGFATGTFSPQPISCALKYVYISYMGWSTCGVFMMCQITSPNLRERLLCEQDTSVCGFGSRVLSQQELSAEWVNAMNKATSLHLRPSTYWHATARCMETSRV